MFVVVRPGWCQIGVNLYTFQTTKRPELQFRTLPSEDGPEIEMVKWMRGG